MKKLISALCALMLAVSLAACSRGPAGCCRLTRRTRPQRKSRPPHRPTPRSRPSRSSCQMPGRWPLWAGDGAALCLCQWSRSGELEHSGMLDAAAVAAVLDAANAAQWAERKAPGVQEFSFDSYVTLSSPAGGRHAAHALEGRLRLCLDAPGGRVWLDQPEGAGPRCRPAGAGAAGCLSAQPLRRRRDRVR